MRGLAILALLLVASCKLADVLPGGAAPQQAIESGVARILSIRNDFNEYVSLSRQFETAEARGDAESAGRFRTAISLVLEQSVRSRESYNQLVTQTARDFATDTMKLALEAVVARYQKDEARALIPPARLFSSHVQAYQASGGSDFDRWHAELLQ